MIQTDYIEMCAGCDGLFEGAEMTVIFGGMLCPDCNARFICKPITPAKGEPMPKTIEHYKANALRDQDLILEQKDEISRLKQAVNNLRQKIKD